MKVHLPARRHSLRNAPKARKFSGSVNVPRFLETQIREKPGVREGPLSEARKPKKSSGQPI